MTVDEYRSFLDQYSRSQTASLEARLEAHERPDAKYGGLIEDLSDSNPQTQANLGELRAQLTAAIGQLEERERLVVTFYFYEGLTLKEIGKTLDLSEGRISQVLRRALTKLRACLQGPALTSGGWQEHPA